MSLLLALLSQREAGLEADRTVNRSSSTLLGLAREVRPEVDTRNEVERKRRGETERALASVLYQERDTGVFVEDKKCTPECSERPAQLLAQSRQPHARPHLRQLISSLVNRHSLRKHRAGVGGVSGRLWQLTLLGVV